MDLPEKEQVQLEQEHSLEVKDIRGEVNYVYVNNSQFSASHTDLHIAFGEAIPSAGVQPRVGVAMSLHHAKTFLVVFSRVLESVEEKIGKIEILPQDLKSKP